MEIDLNGNNIAGTVNFTHNQTGASKLSGTGTVGTVNITTKYASFTQEAGVTVTNLNLIDVKPATYTNAGTVGTVTITDADARFLNNGTTTTVNVNSAGTVILGGSATIPTVVVQKAGNVKIEENTTVTALTVDNTANGETIANAGQIAAVTANADTTLAGTAPSTVTGTGTVSGNALASPENGAIKSAVANVTEGKATFLVAGLLNESNQQKPVKLAEAKTWIDAKYGVNFNAAAIVVTDGNIEIKGSVLSTSDWNKVKANGVKAMPYRITLLKDDTTAGNATVANKVIKVAMYQDGKAVLNNVDNSVITK